MDKSRKLTELLIKKNSFLKEFLRLTVLQKKFLVEKNIDRFSELLDARQAVIKQVDLIDAEIVLYQTSCTKVTRLELDAKHFLQQIIVLDAEINDLMKQNLSETIKSINELQVAKRTESAYRNNARVTQSYFINKQR